METMLTAIYTQMIFFSINDIKKPCAKLSWMNGAVQKLLMLKILNHNPFNSLSKCNALILASNYKPSTTVTWTGNWGVHE